MYMKTSFFIRRFIAAVCLSTLAVVTAAALPRDGGPLIQIALLLDTSNSMDGLINQAKSQLWKIVSEAGMMTRGGRRSRLEVALYEYGNNSNSALSGYVRMVIPFTDDLDTLSSLLFELDTNGGDEYCGQVIKKSVEELDWSARGTDLKIVYIAGNEPFDQGSVDFRDAGKYAVRKGITVNTIFCGSRKEGMETRWSDGALIGGGMFANIDGDYEYQYVQCPQDDRLSELNSLLNDTYIGYGTAGASRKELQQEQDSKAEELNRAGFYERAKVKSSASYSNSAWDLVDATASGAMPLASMKESELPSELRAIPAAEREAYVSQKLAERKKIQSEIAALSSERESWLAGKKADTGATAAFDTAIIAPLAAQAQDKGFVRSE
jgi:hypothetical protein